MEREIVTPSPYPWLALAGILTSAAIWSLVLRQRGEHSDARLALVYFAGLGGGFVGAKLVYLAAEGWLPLQQGTDSTQDLLRHWLTGKSILGALLLGYTSVEATKKLTGYTQTTGDIFAIVTPLGLILGRIGCLLHGCCLGRRMSPAWWTIPDAYGFHRWPASLVELGFNAAFLAFAVLPSRRIVATGQLFHVYLVTYGLFRFAHEFVRETPRIAGPFSGYHFAAIAVVGLGAPRYAQRAAFGTR